MAETKQALAALDDELTAAKGDALAATSVLADNDRIRKEIQEQARAEFEAEKESIVADALAAETARLAMRETEVQGRLLQREESFARRADASGKRVEMLEKQIALVETERGYQEERAARAEADTKQAEAERNAALQAAQQLEAQLHAAEDSADSARVAADELQEKIWALEHDSAAVYRERDAAQAARDASESKLATAVSSASLGVASGGGGGTRLVGDALDDRFLRVLRIERGPPSQPHDHATFVPVLACTAKGLVRRAPAHRFAVFRALRDAVAHDVEPAATAAAAATATAAAEAAAAEREFFAASVDTGVASASGAPMAGSGVGSLLPPPSPAARAHVGAPSAGGALLLERGASARAPFPRKYAQSRLGIALSEAQLEERRSGLEVGLPETSSRALRSSSAPTPRLWLVSLSHRRLTSGSLHS